jgi:hypothetical protein
VPVPNLLFVFCGILTGSTLLKSVNSLAKDRDTHTDYFSGKVGWSGRSPLVKGMHHPDVRGTYCRQKDKQCRDKPFYLEAKQAFGKEQPNK